MSTPANATEAPTFKVIWAFILITALIDSTVSIWLYFVSLESLSSLPEENIGVQSDLQVELIANLISTKTIALSTGWLSNRHRRNRWPAALHYPGYLGDFSKPTLCPLRFYNGPKPDKLLEQGIQRNVSGFRLL